MALSPEVKAGEQLESSSINIARDVDLDVAKSFGLAFEVDDQLKEAYTKCGIDVPTIQSMNEWMLPIPATCVIGTDGVVVVVVAYAFVEADPSKRAEPTDVLDALSGLLSSLKDNYSSVACIILSSSRDIDLLLVVGYGV